VNIVKLPRLFVSLIFTSTILLNSCGPRNIVEPMQSSDALVLLAGDRLERVPATASLFHAGYAKKVILTNDGNGGGWSKKYGRNLKVIEWTEEELASRGVPRSCMVALPYYKSGTMYDALAVMSYARCNSLNKLILVTSDYHAQRALWCFRRLLGDDYMKFYLFEVKSKKKYVLKNILESVKFVYYVFWLNVLGVEPHL